jgi:hypothetical protein
MASQFSVSQPARPARHGGQVGEGLLERVQRPGGAGGLVGRTALVRQDGKGRPATKRGRTGSAPTAAAGAVQCAQHADQLVRVRRRQRVFKSA